MEERSSKQARWPFIRLAIVFQLKLGLDALRDILMSPISIILVLSDIVTSNTHQQSHFIRLMKLGKKSDHWINLFGVDLPHSVSKDNAEETDSNVDYWFTKIEAILKEEQKDGKLSQAAKEKLQQYLAQVKPPSKRSADKSE